MPSRPPLSLPAIPVPGLAPATVSGSFPTESPRQIQVLRRADASAVLRPAAGISPASPRDALHGVPLGGADAHLDGSPGATSRSLGQACFGFVLCTAALTAAMTIAAAL
jgi:hypothetical protein